MIATIFKQLVTSRESWLDVKKAFLYIHAMWARISVLAGLVIALAAGASVNTPSTLTLAPGMLYAL